MPKEQSLNELSYWDDRHPKQPNIKYKKRKSYFFLI